MTTLGNLVDQVLLNVEGFGGGDAAFAVLGGSVASGATTATLTGASGWRTGVWEIGDELVYVTGVATNGNITSMVRGFRGTTVPASHPAGTVVRSNPKFPRVIVSRAINDTIASLFPRLFGVAAYEFTFESAVVRYDLPGGVERVLRVEFLPTGPSEAWVPVRRWRFDSDAGNGTGAAIEVWDAQPGQPVRVVFGSVPAVLPSASTEFTESGLADWMRDVVVLGACWRAASFLDAGRIVTNTANQTLMNGQGRQETGTDLAKYYLGMYAQRLDEAETRLRDDYPAVRHYVA